MNKKTILFLFSISLVLYFSKPIVFASTNYELLLYNETITVIDRSTVHVILNYEFFTLLDEGYYFDSWYKNIHTADAYGIAIEGESGPLSFN